MYPTLEGWYGQPDGSWKYWSGQAWTLGPATPCVSRNATPAEPQGPPPKAAVAPKAKANPGGGGSGGTSSTPVPKVQPKKKQRVNPPPPDDSNESGDYDSSYGEEEEEEEAEVGPEESRPTDDPIVEPSERSASALGAAPKAKAKAKQRPRQPDQADPPQPAPRPEPKPKARERRRGRDGSEGSETSSAARTSEIREMLLQKDRKPGDRSKPSLSQVHIKTFRGSRSHYCDWKRRGISTSWRMRNWPRSSISAARGSRAKSSINFKSARCKRPELGQSYEAPGGVLWRKG